MIEATVLNSRAEAIHEFISRLKRLEDRGDRAILRRNAGETLSTARGAAAVFYRLLPPDVHRLDEELYFLVATLFCLNSRDHTGDFGQTLRDVKARSGKDSVDLRMKVLLESAWDRSGSGELAYRLRQAVKLAASHDVGVNWGKLLEDLHWWSGDQRRVQKQWASSYYRQGRLASGDQADEGGD